MTSILFERRIQKQGRPTVRKKRKVLGEDKLLGGKQMTTCQ